MKRRRAKTLISLAESVPDHPDAANSSLATPIAHRSPSPCRPIEGTQDQIAELLELMNTPPKAHDNEKKMHMDKVVREDLQDVSDRETVHAEVFTNPDPPLLENCLPDGITNEINGKTQDNQQQDINITSVLSSHGGETSGISSMHSSAVSINSATNTPSLRQKRKFYMRKREQKKYLDFISENDDDIWDFEWDSTDWKESSLSSSDSDDLDANKRKKKKCKNRQIRRKGDQAKQVTVECTEVSAQRKNVTIQGTEITDHSADVTVQGAEINVEGIDGNAPGAEITAEGDEVVGDRGGRRKKTNKRKERRCLKEMGKSYERKDGSMISAKSVKQNPCIRKKCPFKCGQITEAKRQSLFEYYWNLNSQRQKDWLATMSRKVAVKRKRTKEPSRRMNTFEYFINDGEGRRQVCLQFLLATLDITHTKVYYTLNQMEYGLSKEEMRGRSVPPNKTKEENLNTVRAFIKKLPAVPSHYCRHDSSKLYLPIDLKNLTNLYDIYKKEHTEKGIDIVSDKIFRTLFKTEFNIGFHIPKKDKCIKCTANSNSTVTTEEMENHLKEKDASDQRFKAHKIIRKENDKFLCTSFDLQKVLQTPHGESMLLYYSRKYSQFNLTFYESGIRNGMCYTWGESEGKRGANEVSTILTDYIKKVDERGTITHLLLYSDSCAGQNKNKIVSATIHASLMNCKNLKCIQMNYLLPGHTTMPVDSMHAVIEISIQNMIIWAPSQWPLIFELARKNPAPYTVQCMTHTDFLGYETATEKYFKGNLVGKISKIRVATFSKEKQNKMAVKYSMQPNAEAEDIEILNKTKIVPAQIYKEPLGISKQKHDDLTKLCVSNVIPTRFHQEYHRLMSVRGIQDTLYDTDVEDSE